jgi:HPt (histidine-containing phosphotransfer) domain-containing protein
MSREVFNSTSFAVRCVRDPELQQEIVEGSLPDIERHIAAIEEAYTQADPEQLERAAHALKGTSGTLSAERLMSSAVELELSAKQGDLRTAGSRVPGLRSLAEEFRRALREHGFHLPEE